MNILSILIGVVALLVAVLGLTPLLGAINYIAIPIAVVGAGLGMLSARKGGRNLNLFVLVVAIIRLGLGGGVI